MRRILLFTLLSIFVSNVSFAQENETVVEPEVAVKKEKKSDEGDGLVDFKKMNKAKDRLVFELFFNHLTNKSSLDGASGNDIKLGWYSRGAECLFYL